MLHERDVEDLLNDNLDEDDEVREYWVECEPVIDTDQKETDSEYMKQALADKYLTSVVSNKEEKKRTKLALNSQPKVAGKDPEVIKEVDAWAAAPPKQSIPDPLPVKVEAKKDEIEKLS